MPHIFPTNDIRMWKGWPHPLAMLWYCFLTCHDFYLTSVRELVPLGDTSGPVRSISSWGSSSSTHHPYHFLNITEHSYPGQNPLKSCPTDQFGHLGIYVRPLCWALTKPLSGAIQIFTNSSSTRVHPLSWVNWQGANVNSDQLIWTDLDWTRINSMGMHCLWGQFLPPLPLPPVNSLL